ncbi:MAG: cyclic lactone autoinducer peptide [Bacillota bacterium]
MKRLLVWLASAAVVLLTLVATAGAASACNFILYEPQVPAQLRK